MYRAQYKNITLNWITITHACSEINKHNRTPYSTSHTAWVWLSRRRLSRKIGYLATYMSRMFRHHNCCFSCRAWRLNLNASPCRASVLSTSSSIFSPRSRTRSIFWTMTFFTCMLAPLSLSHSFRRMKIRAETTGHEFGASDLSNITPDSVNRVSARIRWEIFHLLRQNSRELVVHSVCECRLRARAVHGNKSEEKTHRSKTIGSFRGGILTASRQRDKHAHHRQTISRLIRSFNQLTFPGSLLRMRRVCADRTCRLPWLNTWYRRFVEHGRYIYLDCSSLVSPPPVIDTMVTNAQAYPPSHGKLEIISSEFLADER